MVYIKIYAKFHKSGTFAITVANFKHKTIEDYILQFSLKKPWLLPKVERNYENLGHDLYGWLFVYFGKHYRGVLYETDDRDNTSYDKNTGKHYHFFELEQYKEKMIIKQYIKHEIDFHVEHINENEVVLKL